VYRATTHDEIANRPLPALAGIPRAVFADVHSLGLDDLRRVTPATWQSVEDRLLSGSALAFLRSVSDVRRGFDDRAAALWRPDRRGQPEARKLRERLAALREQQRGAAAGRRRLDEIEVELGRERAAEAELRREGAALAARHRRHAELAPALAAWRDATRLRAEADALLPGDDDLPGDPADAVDRRRAEAADAERAAAAARREADRLRELAAVPDSVRLLSARATDLRALAAEEAARADLETAIGAAEVAARARRADADRRAEAVLGRPLTAADRRALDTVRTADLRGAIAARRGGGARVSFAVATLFAALACVGLAVTGIGGHTLPALGALALVGLALLMARGAARRTPALREAVGSLAVAPSRLAAADPSLPADIDALRAAVDDAEAATAEAERLRELVDERTARLAAALAEIGLPSATQALAAVDQALVRVAEADRATERLPAAEHEAERLTGTAITAAGRRDELLVKLSSLRPGQGLDAAIAAIARARKLRAAAEERIRGANAAHGDVAAIAAEAASLEADGTPLVLDAAALTALEAEQAANARALEDLQRRRGALNAERQALAAQPGVADAAGEAAVYEDLLRATEVRRDRLALAASVLAHAERRFRDEHGPSFLRAAGRYLTTITNGRYDRLLIAAHAGNEPPRLEVLRGGLPVPVAPPLSRGTLEQIYVALRLALVDEIDPGRQLPLYLDEALVNWDDDRLDGLLPLLAALEGRQVLVATCHPELATRLGALGAAVIATPGRREPSPVG
jgi:uncharacterized protein YhaN